MRKTAAIFSLFCGAVIIIVWGTLLGIGNVSELKISPLEAGFPMRGSAT